MEIFQDKIIIFCGFYQQFLCKIYKFDVQMYKRLHTDFMQRLVSIEVNIMDQLCKFYAIFVQI